MIKKAAHLGAGSSPDSQRQGASSRMIKAPAARFSTRPRDSAAPYRRELLYRGLQAQIDIFHVASEARPLTHPQRSTRIDYRRQHRTIRTTSDVLTQGPAQTAAAQP